MMNSARWNSGEGARNHPKSGTFAIVSLRMTRILVSGVSGPIGSALLPSLESNGAGIVRLMRARSGVSPATATEVVPWDPEKHIAPEAVSGFDAVIHLAGESIVGRWSAAKKAKIRDSRVVGTRNLAEALAQAKSKPQVFVCSSAIGYYGDRGDEVLSEKTTAGAGFLAEVCRDWEAATQPASAAGIRTVQIRTGVVLSPKGGALGKMLPPFKMGVGGRIGSGRQWMSWIDIADMVGAIQHILKSDALQGPVNLVAPRPVTNAEFTKTLASVLSRPAIFPVPAFAVKLAFGEMGETVLLGSQRVEAAQLVSSGYQFRFSDLRISLENAIQR
ncbi:conserved hypothetical protein [Candidatus Sulfotelmatobacter kueseliae]|uniref:TIGR01777 family protein n=1 Tax=Candidatus Sulfotelmatobacter kueseliae TaxID=2042962 RepID=A0A2U3KVE0_9BACT|nr:conserved hypothetical protein [Candidatus Sulfotelmatobacter kueseliae]